MSTVARTHGFPVFLTGGEEYGFYIKKMKEAKKPIKLSTVTAHSSPFSVVLQPSSKMASLSTVENSTISHEDKLSLKLDKQWNKVHSCCNRGF